MKLLTSIILLASVAADKLGLGDDCSSAPRDCDLSKKLACMDKLTETIT